MPDAKSSEFGGDPGQPIPGAPPKIYEVLREMHRADPMDPEAGTTAAGVSG